ncbi:hypothetical protein VTL71DRAFT_4049 [Oculimacula yallundae]|uniref:Uncharacterized protein n=1 Tax=Oculimacula yallundae TaxID=86028 RepID=A0ABR4C6K5_9HELO
MEKAHKGLPKQSAHLAVRMHNNGSNAERNHEYQQSNQKTMDVASGIDTASKAQDEDTAMTVESSLTGAKRMMSLSSGVTLNDFTLIPSMESHASHKAATKESEHNAWTPECQAMYERTVKAMEAREAAYRVTEASRPQAISENVAYVDRGTILGVPSQKRQRDESAPASDGLSEIPFAKKARQETSEKFGTAVQHDNNITSRAAPGAFRAIDSNSDDEVTTDRRQGRKSQRGSGPRESKAVENSLINVSPKQQAKREMDFVGTADYYNLLYDDVQPTVGGTYVIVYSRPLNQHHVPCGEYEVYPVSIKNAINVISTRSSMPVQHGKGKSLFEKSGPWLEGELDFNSRTYSFFVEQRYNHDGSQAACEWKAQYSGGDNKSTSLDETLELGTNGDLISTASFGLRYMRTEKTMNSDGYNTSGYRPSDLGFKFILLDFPTWDFVTGVANYRRVIGIKLPEEENVDVGSAFLLNQRIMWPADRSRLICLMGFEKVSTVPQKDARKKKMEKKEKAVSSKTKHKSWAEKVEAFDGAASKNTKNSKKARGGGGA